MSNSIIRQPGFGKFETHLHNGENSACASAPAKDIPKAYRDAGYGGIIVTNHYNRFAFEFLTGGARCTWKNLMDKFLYGYRVMREEGEKIGLKILLGAEISPAEYISPWGGDYPGMELLTYGFDEDFLYENPDLHLLSQKGLFEVAEKNGLLLFQAHPFRPYVVLGDPKYMHGAEVCNKLNARYDEAANPRALAFAEKNNLLKIGGTDFHHLATAPDGLSGVYLPETINTAKDFVAYAKNNELKII